MLYFCLTCIAAVACKIVCLLLLQIVNPVNWYEVVSFCLFWHSSENMEKVVQVINSV